MFRQALSIGDSDFRLYELLRSYSRFSRIAGENIPRGVARDVFVSNLMIDVNAMVEDDGIEPTTPCLQSRCSPS